MVPSGKLATTWILASEGGHVLASAVKALRDNRLKRTALLPCDLLFPVPPTDAFPYPFTGVDFLSWIAQPYYLLSEEDTLDKVEVEQLGPIAQAITDLIRNLMASPAHR